MAIETPRASEKGGSQVELAITLSIGGLILLVVASAVFGGVAQFVGTPRTGFEWLIDTVAFALGAIIGSEFIVALQTFGPVWEGLAIVPALIGGLALGLIVEVATRMLTHGTYAHRPMSA
jgi:hypothetical protein